MAGADGPERLRGWGRVPGRCPSALLRPNPQVKSNLPHDTCAEFCSRSQAAAPVPRLWAGSACCAQDAPISPLVLQGVFNSPPCCHARELLILTPQSSLGFYQHLTSGGSLCDPSGDGTETWFGAQVLPLLSEPLGRVSGSVSGGPGGPDARCPPSTPLPLHNRDLG